MEGGKFILQDRGPALADSKHANTNNTGNKLTFLYFQTHRGEGVCWGLFSALETPRCHLKHPTHEHEVGQSCVIAD